jgi:hypothetical protein
MSEQLYVTIVDIKGQTLVKDLETDWIPPTGTRIDWQHQQPFVIGVVRAVKWTSHNGVTLVISPHEETPGPN